MRAEYTEGVTPEMVLKNLGTSGWTPRQTLDYERDYNDQMAGNTAERMRARILPPGLEPAELTTVPDRYRPDYDLHLIKLVASHLGVPITELGFTEAKGLGNSGLHEGQATVNYRTGTLPDARWWQKLFTRIMRIHLGAPPELEFKFLGLDEEDEGDADAIAETRVRSGRMTVNEDRDRLGLPRYDIPEADTPLIVTTRGVIPLEGALAAAEAASEAAKNLPAPGKPGQGEQPDKGDQGIEGEQGDEGEQLAKAELARFRRWARKRQAPGRQFEFTADEALLTKLAPDLADDERVTFKAGDADPKDLRAWPGWEHDQALAAHYARLIRRALAGAVDTRDLAARWLQARGQATKTADPADSTAGAQLSAQQWLEAAGVLRQLAAVLRTPLGGLWTEGYLVGSKAAQAIHTDTSPDWGNWKPGNPQAARLLLGGDRALQDLLDHYGVTTIQSIAATRLGQLAAQLAESLRDGWSVDRLARELRHVLDDESTADMVATTETARAQSQASMAYYQAAGVDGVEWWTAPTDACPICLGNAADGPIRRGQTFTSGEDAPPAHPRCRCTVAPATLVPIRE
jgi:SPP1 gp7 family putative phage head morphogenesis protein